MTKHLRRLLESTPASDDTERFAIVRAALTASDRFDDAGVLNIAKEVVDPFAKPGIASAQWLLMRGETLRRSGDAASAESVFREVVTRFPDFAPGQNMLAYTLLKENRRLDDALAAAARATTLSPGSADYFDTLARVQLARGDLDAAEKAFRSALSQGDDCLDALVGLARLQLQRGRRADAAGTLARIDRQLKLVTTTTAPDTNPDTGAPRHLRDELATVRQGLASVHE
ncbi:MAG: tetratricopeptide repeat protein [Tepidisphaeraceae bacterium]